VALIGGNADPHQETLLHIGVGFLGVFSMYIAVISRAIGLLCLQKTTLRSYTRPPAFMPSTHRLGRLNPCTGRLPADDQHGDKKRIAPRNTRTHLSWFTISELGRRRTWGNRRMGISRSIAVVVTEYDNSCS